VKRDSCLMLGIHLCIFLGEGARTQLPVAFSLASGAIGRMHFWKCWLHARNRQWKLWKLYAYPVNFEFYRTLSGCHITYVFLTFLTWFVQLLLVDCEMKCIKKTWFVSVLLFNYCYSPSSGLSWSSCDVTSIQYWAPFEVDWFDRGQCCRFDCLINRRLFIRSASNFILTLLSSICDSCTV
jgi:hypothetical protein